MLKFITLFNRIAGIISWVQEMIQRNRIKREISNEIQENQRQWVKDANAIRDSVVNDSSYRDQLLREVSPRPSGEKQHDILSSLQASLHRRRNSGENKEWHLKKLRNMEGAVYGYSSNSLRKLETCHGELQLIALEMSREYNCTVVCGTRSLAEQEKAYNSGASKLKPGESKHNRFPSDAIDLVPYEAVLLWKHGKDLSSDVYKEFAKRVFRIANRHEIKLRWGGDWDGDGDSTDQTFMDFAHYERL